MSWQTEMVPIVRYLINDIDGTAYTDARIQNTILVAAQLVQNDIDFSKTYTISVGNSGLTPDPTDATRDDGFINLVALKSACIIADSEARTYARQSISITDGPSSINLSGIGKSMKELADKLCEDYARARHLYQTGQATGIAVMTPYTYESIPTNPGNFV